MLPRASNAFVCGSATSIAKAGSARTTLVWSVCRFDKRGLKLATSWIENFNYLSKSSEEMLDYLAAQAFCWRGSGLNGVNIARKGVKRERLLQVIRVVIQVAMPRVPNRHMSLGAKRETRAQIAWASNWVIFARIGPWT